MSEDRVVGVAVLDRARGKLHLCCHSHDQARPYQEALDVIEAGSAPTKSPQWIFLVNGDDLECHPSVHVRVMRAGVWQTIFHNSFNWKTKFIELPDLESLPVFIDRNHAASSLCYFINERGLNSKTLKLDE